MQYSGESETQALTAKTKVSWELMIQSHYPLSAKGFQSDTLNIQDGEGSPSNSDFKLEQGAMGLVLLFYSERSIAGKSSFL